MPSPASWPLTSYRKAMSFGWSFGRPSSTSFDRNRLIRQTEDVAGTGSVFAMKFKGGLGTTLKMSRKKQCSEVGSCARGERFVGAVNRRKLDKKCVEDSPTNRTVWIIHPSSNNGPKCICNYGPIPISIYFLLIGLNLNHLMITEPPNTAWIYI